MVEHVRRKKRLKKLQQLQKKENQLLKKLKKQRNKKLTLSISSGFFIALKIQVRVFPPYGSAPVVQELCFRLKETAFPYSLYRLF